MRTTASIACMLGSIVLLAGAANVEGQTPRAGSVGVAFDLPEGGGTGFGLRYLWSDGVNMGVHFDFDLEYELSSADDVGSDDDSQTTWAVGFTPDFRFYQGNGTIAPFFELGAGVTYARPTQEDMSDLVVRGSIGIGAEWFPTQSVGISGSTGLETRFLHTSYGEDAGILADTTEDTLNAGIFRSALTINLYF